MTRDELIERTNAAKAETHNALQMVVDELNQGQRKKLARVDAIRTLFERYGVEIDDR